MTISDSRFAYSDCFEAWEKALNDEVGVRIPVKDIDAAYHLRMRLHQARKIERRENKDTYPDAGHHMHGKSVYDTLIVQIKNDEGVWIHIVRGGINVDEIQPLSEATDGASA